MANLLSHEKRRSVLALLCEGCSVRAIERLTRIHRDTVLRLLLRAGEHCHAVLDREIRGILCSSLQCDELWTFVHKKQRQVLPGDPPEYGDNYCYLAIDRESKLIAGFDLGKRDEPTTDRFIASLAQRIDGEVQIFTDGWSPYRRSIPRHFGSRAHFAQVVKHFGDNDDESHRYSPSTVRSVEHVWVQGYPQAGLVSTSHVERANWTIRGHLRRFTRRSNGFSRKLANLRAAVALYVCWFNWCRKHNTLRTSPAVACGLASEIWPIDLLIPN